MSDGVKKTKGGGDSTNATTQTRGRKRQNAPTVHDGSKDEEGGDADVGRGAEAVDTTTTAAAEAKKKKGGSSKKKK